MLPSSHWVRVGGEKFGSGIKSRRLFACPARVEIAQTQLRSKSSRCLASADGLTLFLIRLLSPQDVPLEDDTLLPKIQFSEAVAATPARMNAEEAAYVLALA